MGSVPGDHVSPLDQFKSKLFDCAASGDVDVVKNIIRGVDLNMKNERGWTALMFAARNGHESVIQLLLENGADRDVINSTGQTALDIALFWNHKKATTVLSQSNSEGQNVSKPLQFNQQDINNFFSRNPLDRAGNKRRDPKWVESMMTNSETKYVAFSNLMPFMMTNTTSPNGQFKICTVTHDQIITFMSNPCPVVLLGLETDSYDADNKIAWFAVELGQLTEEQQKALSAQGEFIDGYRSLLQVNSRDAAIVGQARSMLAWHDRYRFCATCGSETRIEEAGYKITCKDDQCRSNKGVHNTSYPRTDPVVIMVVISPDRKQCLMGRGARHPKKMYSCLAGFMEPGETIEEAVRREVHEESGILIGRVDYHSCQPWPHPSSLMIGCLAYAVSTEIKIDPQELEHAQWFDRQEVVQMLTHQHKEGLFTPPEQAIAHQLIRAWVTMTANL